MILPMLFSPEIQMEILMCAVLVDNWPGFKGFFILGRLTVTRAGRSTRSAISVALLQHADHGVGFLLGGHHADGLVLVRVELGARGRG